MLKDVTGDFVATVRVAFPIRPTVNPMAGADSPGRAGAGIVVWGGSDTFLTLTRNEVAREGKPAGELSYFHTYPRRTISRHYGFSPDDGIYLRVSRKGQSAELAYSEDGKKWKDFGEFEVAWEETVGVGPVAPNVSDRLFVATFDEYTVTQPKK